MDLPDADLLRATAAGDRDAFGEFLSRHTATVLRSCLMRLGGRQGSDDVAQEAVLRLYEQVRKGRIPEDPLPWLLAILRTCCREFQRHHRRHGVQPLPDGDGPAIEDVPGPDTEELSQAMTELNDFETAVLHMKHTEGLRCQQISERLGKPLGTVTAAISRAYAKLRARLERESAR